MTLAKLSKIRASKQELSQTLNLKEIFGHDFSRQGRLKEAIAQVVIDHITKRTERGKAVGGRRNLKAPYSREYQDSLEFKAAGKSPNTVNMTLTGDMLRSIDVLESKGNTIKIGIDDSFEAPKAFNHQTGDTVPKRDFFGLNQTDLRAITRELRKEVKDAFRGRGEQRDEAADSLALVLLRELREEATDGEG